MIEAWLGLGGFALLVAAWVLLPDGAGRRVNGSAAAAEAPPAALGPELQRVPMHSGSTEA